MVCKSRLLTDSLHATGNCLSSRQDFFTIANPRLKVFRNARGPETQAHIQLRGGRKGNCGVDLERPPSTGLGGGPNSRVNASARAGDVNGLRVSPQTSVHSCLPRLRRGSPACSKCTMTGSQRGRLLSSMSPWRIARPSTLQHDVTSFDNLVADRWPRQARRSNPFLRSSATSCWGRVRE